MAEAAASGRSADRVRFVAALAVSLALAGAIVTVWRPVAPPLPQATSPLAMFDPDLLDVVRTYRRPRYAGAALAVMVTLAVPLLLGFTTAGRRLLARIAGARAHAPLRAALVAATVVAATSLALLPVSVWIGFFHEGRWGFRRATAAMWMRDWLVVTGLRWLLVAAVVGALAFAIHRWPRSWPYRLTLAATVAAAALVFAHPVLLQPLLLPTRPLPEGSVREQLRDVLVAAGEPTLPIVVGDASRRTTRSNALVTGLGPTEQLVLYDTLLELPIEQIVTTVAHELAHHEHRDLERGALASATAALPLFLLLHVLLEQGMRRTAATGHERYVRGPTDPRLAAVAVALIVVVELAGGVVANVASRRVEAAADHRAIEWTGDPGTVIRTIRTFVVRDLSAPDPPRWVQLLYGTHPTPAERITAAAAAAEAMGLTLPELAELEAAEQELHHPLVPG